MQAGATLRYVYDPAVAKVAACVKAFAAVEVLARPDMVAAACVTSERAALGLRVMTAEGLFC